jgi:hypothetical protein
MKDTMASTDLASDQDLKPAQTQLTPAGFNAIRGMTTEKGQPDYKTVNAVTSREIVQAPSVLNASAANDLEIASQQAIAAKATRWHGESTQGKEVEYYRIRSEIGEELAVKNIPGSVQADAFSKAGTNFPNYDVLSPQEASSIKVRAFQDEKPSTQYRDDFAALVYPNSHKNQKAAHQLLTLKTRDQAAWAQLAPHLSSEIQTSVSAQRIQESLAQIATLRIPADQVDAVRTDLITDMGVNPGKYGLDANSEPENLADKIHQMAFTRILAIDARYDTVHYQSKAAEMVQEREKIIQGRIFA